MRAVDWLLDLLYPPRCMFCRKLIAAKEDGVCRDCRTRIPRVPSGDLRRDIKHISFCVSPWYYEGDVRQALLRYKFRGVTAYGRIFAGFMAKSIDEIHFSCDIITWVPLSRRRLRARGYDQARILAEELAGKLGVPCVKLLEKQVDTKPQSSLERAEQRRENARGAYRCPDRTAIAGKSILLVDDIVTTGSTLSECARVLKEAGCREIIAATAATRQ